LVDSFECVKMHGATTPKFPIEIHHRLIEVWRSWHNENATWQKMVQMVQKCPNGWWNRSSQLITEECESSKCGGSYLGNPTRTEIVILSVMVELNAKSVHNIVPEEICCRQVCVCWVQNVWRSSTIIDVSESFFHVFSDLNKKETTYWTPWRRAAGRGCIISLLKQNELQCAEKKSQIIRKLTNSKCVSLLEK